MEIDFSNKEFIINPFPILEKYRKEHAVVWAKEDTFFALSYKACEDLLKNENLGYPTNEDNSSKSWKELFNNKHITSILFQLEKSDKFMSMWMNLRNNEDHNRIRKLFLPAFRKNAIDELQGQINLLCDELIDELKTKKEADLVHDFCLPLTTQTLLHLLGLNEEKSQDILNLSYQLYQTLRISPPHQTIINRKKYIVECARFFNDILNTESKISNDGFLHYLRQKINSKELSEDEFIANATFLFIAGYNSTQSLISNTIKLLLQNNLWTTINQNNFEHLNSAINESLRFEAPAPYISKFVLNDFSYGGVDFKRGQAIYILLISANRDENVFENANIFNLHRKPNNHFSFGLGRNYCIGTFLAMAQTETAIKKLRENFPNLTLIGENSVEWNTAGNADRSLEKLKVKL
ncbi:MAG: cytochrome P450 [Flavobacteriales bacterium]